MVDLEYWPKRFILLLDIVLCGLDYAHVSLSFKGVRESYGLSVFEQTLEG